MAHHSLSLNPPWVTLLNQFTYTIGLDPAVTVGKLDTQHKDFYVLPIIVDDGKKGISLCTIIREQFVFGNNNVITRVQNSAGKVWEGLVVTSLDQLMSVCKDALTGNPLFVEAIEQQPLPGLQRVAVIIAKEVVQFYNDDVSDAFGNYNAVAAQVFGIILKEDIDKLKKLLLTYSTARSRSVP